MKLMALPPEPTPAYRSADLADQQENYAYNYEYPSQCHNHWRDGDKVAEDNEHNPENYQWSHTF
jgi:hypothetical protein